MRCAALAALLVGVVACDDDSSVSPDTGAPDAATTDQRADAPPADAPPAQCLITTKSGPVQGVLKSNGVCAYLGIPYAKPPLKELRWKPPQPPTAWTAPFIADKPGHVCPQVLKTWWGGTANEDCLNLNVWATPNDSAASRPVLVWIHQGKWNLEGGSTLWSEGDKLAAEQDVVVVSFNFRLNALGGLAHPALGSDSGNYGFLDQVAVLKWVQDNIAQFGGDPNSVTLAGGNIQGGQAVCEHLVSSRSKGLFHRAIMHSGSCLSSFHQGYAWKGPLLTRAEAEAQGQQLAQDPDIQCDSAADVATCLRGKDPDTINTALTPFSIPTKVGADAQWGPIIEPGGVLEDTPFNLIKANKIANPVPVLLGTNHLEFGEFTRYYESMTAQDLTAGVSYDMGAKAPAILALYDPVNTPPVGTCSAACTAWIYLDSDAYWVCPARRSARALTAAGLPTYLYYLSYPNWKSITQADGTPFVPQFGASLWSALVYLFDADHPTPSANYVTWPFNAEEKVLSREIRDYWVRFMRTGDPNGGSAKTWDKYDATTDRHLVLDAPITMDSGLRKTYCDFWDTLVP